LVPNEALLPGRLGKRLGELVQILIDEGADVGISLEIDTSDRTRPGEQRGGASPIESIDMLVVAAAAGFGGRQLERLQDRLFDAAVNWVMRRRKKGRHFLFSDPIAVNMYGPDGEVIKSVLVPQGRGNAQPTDRLGPDYQPGRD
jgi:hypothetical protein